MKNLKKSTPLDSFFILLFLITITTITTFFAYPVAATNDLDDLACYEIKLKATPLNGGVLSGNGIYEEGTEINLVAEENDGYYFTGWVENDELISTDSNLYLTVTENRELIAVFETHITSHDNSGSNINLNYVSGEHSYTTLGPITTYTQYLQRLYGHGKGRITQYPSTGHMAIDSVNDGPTPHKVYALSGGVIQSMGTDSHGGLYIYVRVPELNNNRFLYLHFASRNPSLYVGQTIKTGHYLGIEGSTGFATGRHTHFAVIDRDNVWKELEPWYWLNRIPNDGGYPPPTGSIRVTIEPVAACSAGAQWRLTSGPDTGWKNSGSTISNLPVDSYTITYKDITGWNKPSNAIVSVSSNQTTSRTGTYNITSHTLYVRSTNPASGVTITSSTGHGGTTGDNEYQISVAHGTSVNLTAPQYVGSGNLRTSFQRWDGTHPSSNRTVSGIMDGNKLFRAIYVDDPETVCDVNRPNPPTGPTTVNINTTYNYSTGGSTCSLGHNIQYRFAYDVDAQGNWIYSNWGSESQGLSWSQPGPKRIFAQARCTHSGYLRNRMIFLDINVLHNHTAAPTVSAGGSHSLALKRDGTVWAWGYNAWEGRLGDGSTASSSSPVRVSGLNDVLEISAGREHSLALKSNGTVWAWGNNNDGRLGDCTHNRTLTPVQVCGLNNVVAISAGGSHSLALKSDGTVWAWGKNNRGQLGDGTKRDNVPVQVSDLSGVVAISAGYLHSLALKGDGTVWAWGGNYEGQLGDGTTTERLTPKLVSELSYISAISADGAHSVAIKSDGTVWAWGRNSSGQLGDGSTKRSLTPVRVENITDIVGISAKGNRSAALTRDGIVWGWGYNYYGQLGDGTKANASEPVHARNLSDVLQLSAGGSHTLALKSDGSVWSWGFNSSGRLGDGTTTNRLTPVKVPNFNLEDSASTLPPTSFSDVPTNHFFYTEINALAASGIVTGYPDGTFSPSDNVTRMATAAFLYRALNLADPGVTVPTFSDVPTTHPFFKEIEALAASNIVTGYSDGTFKPSAEVTRMATAAFLYRAFGLTDPGVTIPTFSDVSTTHPFFKEIEALAASEITTGYEDGTFKPSAIVNRMATAAFLYRGLEFED